MKNIVKNIWKKPELAEDPAFIGKLAAVHGKGCSCPLCMNKRHNKMLKNKYRLTKQERIFNEPYEIDGNDE